MDKKRTTIKNEGILGVNHILILQLSEAEIKYRMP